MIKISNVAGSNRVPLRHDTGQAGQACRLAAEQAETGIPRLLQEMRRGFGAQQKSTAAG